MPEAITDKLFSLAGKSALVTGASGGIGRAVSAALARAGAFVGLSGANAENLSETERFVKEAGGRCAVLRADLSTVADCRALARSASQALGALDILVNNAGMNRRKLLVDFTEDDYE